MLQEYEFTRLPTRALLNAAEYDDDDYYGDDTNPQAFKRSGRSARRAGLEHPPSSDFLGSSWRGRRRPLPVDSTTIRSSPRLPTDQFGFRRRQAAELVRRTPALPAAALRRIFRLLDRDSRGAVHVDDLRHALHDIGYAVRGASLCEVAAQSLRSATGTLAEDEFLTWAESHALLRVADGSTAACGVSLTEVCVTPELGRAPSGARDGSAFSCRALATVELESWLGEYVVGPKAGRWPKSTRADATTTTAGTASGTDAAQPLRWLDIAGDDPAVLAALAVALQLHDAFAHADDYQAQRVEVVAGHDASNAVAHEGKHGKDDDDDALAGARCIFLLHALGVNHYPCDFGARARRPCCETRRWGVGGGGGGGGGSERRSASAGDGAVATGALPAGARRLARDLAVAMGAEDVDIGVNDAGGDGGGMTDSGAVGGGCAPGCTTGSCERATRARRRPVTAALRDRARLLASVPALAVEQVVVIVAGPHCVITLRQSGGEGGARAEQTAVGLLLGGVRARLRRSASSAGRSGSAATLALELLAAVSELNAGVRDQLCEWTRALERGLSVASPVNLLAPHLFSLQKVHDQYVHEMRPVARILAALGGEDVDVSCATDKCAKTAGPSGSGVLTQQFGDVHGGGVSVRALFRADEAVVKTLARANDLIASDMEQLEGTVARLRDWTGTLAGEHRDRILYYVAITTLVLQIPQIMTGFYGMNFADFWLTGIGIIAFYNFCIGYVVVLFVLAALYNLHRWYSKRQITLHQDDFDVASDEES